MCLRCRRRSFSTSSGIPLTPVRLKCAILGLGVLKLALHKSRGTPLPEEWGTSSRDLVLE